MPGLEDLYREIILDHYRSPRNRGSLETPPAVVAQGHNPLCGDEIQVYLLVDGDMVKDVKVGGQGCSISQSSASMMTSAVKGRSIDEVRAIVARFKQMMTVEEGADGGVGIRDRNQHRVEIVPLQQLAVVLENLDLGEPIFERLGAGQVHQGLGLLRQQVAQHGGEAYGAHAELVTETSQFAPAFERARTSGRAALIEIRLDPEVISHSTTLSALRGN